ncbi:glucose-6-phosphate dehydrogenase [Gigaspora margarita]|uniref:Glucose-6-phosphate 1-dehydrogenase n=1 Tax=Gigaspora margarita TaxID=4874 RepID=A0A8H4AKI5_GIGMA|nr:glucose-6-phosphate dehydrogenase [Gigaspora margarita]
MQNHLLQILSIVAMERPISLNSVMKKFGAERYYPWKIQNLMINNKHWKGVPFIFKCGKALNEQQTEIQAQIQHVSGNLFKNAPRNELVIRV